jgi:secreted PhoX family phosphatase
MMARDTKRLSRRQLLIEALHGAGMVGAGLVGAATLAPAARAAGADDYGELQDPDENGIRLPVGFTSRVVAVTGSPVPGTTHVWHVAPDGGATFATDDGGWVYVSNSEVDTGAGGVGAIRFASDGSIEDAYSILSGTHRNCAGGPTPWRTWLSCEEVNRGQIYECDPFAPGSEGIVHPAMGIFSHEAAAVDPVDRRVYLTEDQPNGLLYRFTPNVYPDLAAGALEAAEILDPQGEGAITPGQTRPLAWHVVPDPSASSQATRFQVVDATIFNGGEGCWYQQGTIVFSSKGDNRVWAIDTRTSEIRILYDLATSSMPILSGVDNVLGVSNGDILVAEDGGDMELVALTASGQVLPIVQVTGQPGSEITGPALSPDGTRLYFSSQRSPGTTYEITGPFGVAPPPVPSFGWPAQLVLGTALLTALRSQLSAR